MTPFNMSNRPFFASALLAGLLAVLPAACGQVWINTNVASTSGPLPGASPVALTDNASILYFPSQLKLLTNLYLHDDWNVPLHSRIFAGTSDTNASTLTYDLGYYSTKGSYAGVIGLQDAAEGEFYRLYASDGTVYGKWGTNQAVALWSQDDPFTNAPEWNLALQTNSLASTNWVANALADYLPLSGGTLSGPVDMGGQWISNITAISSVDDLVLSGASLVMSDQAEFYARVEFGGEWRTNWPQTNGFISAESDPAWSAWRTNAAANTTNAILANGTLVDISSLLGGGGGGLTNLPVTSEIDPVFTNWIATNAAVALAESALQPADTNGWVVGSHSTFLSAESDPVYATGSVTRSGLTISGNTTSEWDAATQTLSIYGDGGGDPVNIIAGTNILIGKGDTNWTIHADASKLVTNNQGSVWFGRLNATTVTATYAEANTGLINNDLTVLGNLHVTSNFTVNSVTTSNIWTNVMLGVSTTYVADVYATNYVYTYQYVGTQQITTNLVTTYVQSGGSFGMGAGSTFDATNAAAVRFPFFSSTATGDVAAIGNWDVSGATFTGLGAKETDPIFTNWLAAQGANFQAPLAAIADGTATLNVTSRTWRVVQGGDTLTNWAFTGANTNSVVSFVVSLERGAGTFAWPSGNTNAAAANSTNVFFIYRPAGREPWIVE